MRWADVFAAFAIELIMPPSIQVNITRRVVTVSQIGITLDYIYPVCWTEGLLSSGIAFRDSVGQFSVFELGNRVLSLYCPS